MTFLIFRLAGVTTAFGEIAVGERRGVWQTPSKSGVLGFLAACLGIRRIDSDALYQLDRSLGFAVRVEAVGALLRDFHTAQTPKEADRSRRRRRGTDLSTRRADLNTDKGNLTTVLSDRIYRLEAISTVAIWQKSTDSHDLVKYLEHLHKPIFIPYLGRRTCVLSEPPDARIIASPHLLSAFAIYDAEREKTDLVVRKSRFRPSRMAAMSPQVWFEVGAGLSTEEALAIERRIRRDGFGDRSLWHFREREEARLQWPSYGELSFEELVV